MFINWNSKGKVKERHNTGPERKPLSTQYVYLAKLSFLIEGKTKAFHNKEN
jgi:hypothetical protein